MRRANTSLIRVIRVIRGGPRLSLVWLRLRCAGLICGFAFQLPVLGSANGSRRLKSAGTHPAACFGILSNGQHFSGAVVRPEFEDGEFLSGEVLLMAQVLSHTMRR